MKVQSVGHQQMLAAQSKITENRGKPAEAKAQAETGTEKKAENQVPQSQGKAKGVIRLLEEGHFKGVADVRLRINFHDQITAANGQKAAEALEAGASQLVTDLGNVLLPEPAADTASEIVDGVPLDIAAMIAELGVSEEVSNAFAVFEEAVNGLFEGSGDGQADVGLFLDEIQNAFGGFINALTPRNDQEQQPETVGANEITVEDETLASVSVDGSPGEVTEDTAQVMVDNVNASAGDEGGDAEPLQIADLTNALQGWFDGRLEELRTGIEHASSLPLLSEPSGNGVAYDRFLAIYNEMNQAQADVADGSLSPFTTDGVDAEV